jgi:hypothetical protein
MNLNSPEISPIQYQSINMNTVTTVEAWNKFHYDRVATEFTDNISEAINNELRLKTFPPFNVTVMLRRILTPNERVALNSCIKRLLRGSGWDLRNVIHHEDICRIVFDLDGEISSESMNA